MSGAFPTLAQSVRPPMPTTATLAMSDPQLEGVMADSCYGTPVSRLLCAGLCGR